MAITTRLDLRQSQSLVMTPQLQQAIKLLQLSNIELAAYVEQQLEENPLLERQGDDGDRQDRGDGPEAGAVRETERDGPDEGVMATTSDFESTETAGDNLWSGDNDAASFREEDSFLSLANWGPAGAAGPGGGRMDFSAPTGGLEDKLTEGRSLRDHLMAQVNMDLTDPVDRLIAADLVERLDEAGYLTGELEATAERLGCPVARVAETLERLQRFDPPGIFARNLAECLAIQLKDRDRFDPAMAALVAHLDLLGKRDKKALMKCCGVDAEDFADMVAEIRALNPKPALAFDTISAEPVTPDILMRPRQDGGWHIELNTDTLPRVLVNNRYYSQISNSTSDRKAKQYITEQLHSANWLVKALHQRAKTVLRVAEEIVRQQEKFFTNGVGGLKPLVLRDIAEAIEMHESTVSRVTTNKYIETPRGIYELKYFFTTAIPGAAGESAHSAEAIRHRIKMLIDKETAETVLSDDRIVAILRGEGVEIARRTVAKYREALRIPSSVARRREKMSAF